MSDTSKETKDVAGGDAVFKEPASPKNLSKKEKTKYQTFKSDEDDSSENEENDPGTRLRRKLKKDRSNTTSFKVKIKSIKKKEKKEKKEKDRDKEKDTDKKDKNREKKRVKKTDDSGKDKNQYPLHDLVFGVPLDVAVDRSGFPDKIELPRIVRECILFIEEKGLDTEGIYRVSGVKSKVDHLKSLYNEGRPVTLDECDPNTIASLLKLYLRELPSSILTARLAPIFDNCINLDNKEEQMNRFHQLLNDLPCPNRTLLQWMFTHFAHVMELSAVNKMNIQNLSIVFSPTMSISHGVLNIFFQHTREFFPNIKLTKYIPPLEDNDGLPNTLQGLQELLEENETVLAELHDKVNQGDSSQDEELWERQRRATQIKRKIRALKKIEKQKTEIQKTEIQNTEAQKEYSETPKPDSQHTIPENQSNISAEPHYENVKLLQKPSKHVWKAEVIADKSSNAQKLTESTGNQPATDEKSVKATLLQTAIKQKKKKAPEPPKVAKTTITETTSSATALKTPATVATKQTDVEHLSSDDFDEEYKEMLREEQRLLIESEELLNVSQMIKRKIQIEQREIEAIKQKIHECLEHKENKHELSSSASSFSSSSSLSQEDDDQGFMSGEEDLLQLEMILSDLEKDNERLEIEGKELVVKISAERKLCSKLRTDIRVKESTLLAAR